jgi:hypothetical protein
MLSIGSLMHLATEDYLAFCGKNEVGSAYPASQTWINPFCVVLIIQNLLNILVNSLLDIILEIQIWGASQFLITGGNSLYVQHLNTVTITTYHKKASFSA